MFLDKLHRYGGITDKPNQGHCRGLLDAHSGYDKSSDAMDVPI